MKMIRRKLKINQRAVKILKTMAMNKPKRKQMKKKFAPNAANL
jgi:uncharacterized membrane protein YgaE (UPF0421/DUF939 family)